MNTHKTLSTIMMYMIILIGTPLLYGQSQTTGTLNLRNGQPATVSLTLPSTGVTGYTMSLPPVAGAAGQALTIQNVTGSTATLEWTNASFWKLDGTSITTGGTGATQQYLGTSNAQDLVLAANGTEALRLVGVAGPGQGFIAIGTTTPRAPVDIGKNVLLSNSGLPTELRFGEPSAGGLNYTAFRATTQAADITYTLPDAPPLSDGMVLTSTTTGTMSWTRPLQNIVRGIFVPVVGNFVHVIPMGTNITSGSIPVVTMINPPGTTIGISITAIDDVNDTITVETSAALGTADKIAWLLVHPF
ncbi:MAG: hypothetical protein IPH85_07590 [Ignavibacteria bacterium]|nr:hypothetical protein [Ignavibacteria bacterium]MBP6509364.1 hypothetical protein [Candidatus Kapabacteria bacterium]MBK6418292.1 hypothetical protein [Ignavibacteria bacterium]MBK6761164.1 hypothetical protein [Ignavibacteria bacterium]MBK7032190.1 hypothetical protein [Ignavibacteria bacterium]